VSASLNRGLVEQLARLPDEQRREIANAACAERRRRIRGAVNQIRRSMLPNVSKRKAAQQIAAAAHDRHNSTDQVLRAAIRTALGDDLGSVDDVPDADRIRQLFE
jgi:DNA-binding FrmR family transcriptional regulator